MKTVLVIREQDEFSRILSKNGFEVINLPMIETKPLEDLNELETKLEKLEDYDGIFLTSQNAARILAQMLRVKSKGFDGKVYVLGKRSYDLLKAENLNLVFNENANTAGEMLLSTADEVLKNKRFLFIRGEKSLRTVPDFLENVATVDEAVVYRTEKIAIEVDKIKNIGEKIKKGEIAAICFFSPSAADSFLEQFGDGVLHQITIATIGETTAKFFERRGLEVGFISPKAVVDDFAVGLIEFLGKS